MFVFRWSQNLRVYVVCEVGLALYAKVSVIYDLGTMLDTVNRVSTHLRPVAEPQRTAVK